jgi:hypothetical protein
VDDGGLVSYGLVSYGVNLGDIYRRAASFIDKVRKIACSFDSDDAALHHHADAAASPEVESALNVLQAVGASNYR